MRVFGIRPPYVEFYTAGSHPIVVVAFKHAVRAVSHPCMHDPKLIIAIESDVEMSSFGMVREQLDLFAFHIDHPRISLIVVILNIDNGGLSVRRVHAPNRVPFRIVSMDDMEIDIGLQLDIANFDFLFGNTFPKVQSVLIGNGELFGPVAFSGGQHRREEGEKSYYESHSEEVSDRLDWVNCGDCSAILVTGGYVGLRSRSQCTRLEFGLGRQRFPKAASR